jgi:hypothetical protein
VALLALSLQVKVELAHQFLEALRNLFRCAKIMLIHLLDVSSFFYLIFFPNWFFLSFSE